MEVQEEGFETLTDPGVPGGETNNGYNGVLQTLEMQTVFYTTSKQTMRA